jgi:hypothetical protein
MVLPILCDVGLSMSACLLKHGYEMSVPVLLFERGMYNLFA